MRKLAMDINFLLSLKKDNSRTRESLVLHQILWRSCQNILLGILITLKFGVTKYFSR